MTGSHHSLQLWVNLPAADKNDRAALPGSRRRCCSCAARTGRGGSGLFRRIRRGDSADKEFCARYNGRNPFRPRRLGRQESFADYNALIVILEGEGAIGAEGKSVTAGDVAGLTRGDNRKAGASPIPGLSTTRIRRPDPNATSKRRSQLSALSWRAASQDACRAALVANALTYDTVRLDRMSAV